MSGKIKYRSLSEAQKKEYLGDFYNIVSSLHGYEEAKNFFKDLLTTSEMVMICRRIQIAKLLTPKAKRKFGEGNYTSKNAIKWKGDKLTEGVDYIIEEQFQFANFVIEDDTDFITVRLSQLKFPEYGKLIFEDIKPDDVVVVKGRIGSGIRMFFANKIVSLRHYNENKQKS